MIGRVRDLLRRVARGAREGLGRMRLGERLGGARYFVGDLLYLASRPFRALGRGAAQGWSSLSVVARRRIAAALLVGAILALGVFVIAPSLPCSAPGGEECAPSDDAIELVPAEALTYVHANLDSDTEQYEAAAAVAARTPLVAAEVAGRALVLFAGAGGAPPDFGADIAPWLGGEIALAEVPGTNGNQQVQLLEAADTDAAREYAASIAQGEPTESDHQGVEILEDERGLASAVVEDFLVLGPIDGVRAILDVATGADDTESLADEGVADDAFDELPEDRFAAAYLSAEGIDSNLAVSTGPFASLEPFVDSSAADGAALSLSADEEGFRLAIRSVLNPERSEDADGFFAAFEPFEPSLAAELPPETLAYFGIGQASETVTELLDQATVRAPGIAEGAADLAARLRDAAGVDLAQDLLPAIGGEGAFAVVPEPAEAPAGADSEQVVPGSATPFLEFLADGVDEERALDALARLQGPISESVDPALGTPGFEQETIGGVETQILQLSANTVLAYAVASSRLLVANSTTPFESLGTDEGGGLQESDAYRAATDGLAEEPAFVAYLDLAGVLAFGEREGLAGDTAYSTFASDLRLLRTLGLTVSRGEDSLETDVRLRIASP